MKRGKKNYSDSSEEEEDETVPLKKAEQDNRLWDAFQDPPVLESSGSSADFTTLETIIKLLKVFTFGFVFIVILGSSVVSKMSLLFMTSHIKKDVTVPFCDLTQPEKQFNAEIPLDQRIAWIWSIVFAFAVPEVGTIIRAFRICFFKNKRKPTWDEWGTVALFESFHVVGLAILVMYVLPELDVIKGVMLTNCLCLIPGILSFITKTPKTTTKSKSGLKLGIDALAIVLQITGLVVWPLMNNKLELWFIPVALLLISFHWWENYVADNCFFGFISSLAQKRDQIHESRYFMYLTIAPWKIILFLVSVMALSGENFVDFFNLFISGWGVHTISIIETLPIFSDTLPNLTSIITSNGQLTEVTSTHLSIFYVFLTHMLASYICYVFSKFACKIQIQSFSFAFPVNLTVPVSVSVLLILCGLRESDVCYFHSVLPDYLFFKSPPIYNLLDYLTNEYAWIWILWLISQSWITQHIWTPKCDKNASTDILFVSPLYNSLIIDQSLTMNRRRDDKEEHFKINQKQEIDDSGNLTNIEVVAKSTNTDDNKHDSIPQIFICATMWHENKEEMMEFLKSILRLDEDQCARRMAQRYLRPKNDVDQEYYDLETHIFFDDAFVSDKKKVEDPDASPINDYVKLLINNLEEAAREVYKTKMKIYPPTRVVTPYGGRLIWTLPGRTKMIAHLKNKNKIRHKKRWSQVMYMYYLLGYRIMQLDISTERKLLIAQNTYLLALDGDIDFQPKAVSLLIGRMKVDPDLGAACGRIHPIGAGPMVWYQVFEYAIGHWLQKSTEHIIGCVLCSPGCFSLFRGRALMENSVMKKYTTTSENPLHYVQYDQGEDRWLCTLLLKQQFRVEYSAASDAYTHAPEGFNEFYNQRRRWVPSTMANILDLLADAKTIVQKNNSISMPYIIYQGMMMGGSVLGPGTIFLMMVGSLVAVFNISQWTSFLWNFIPILIFMGICYFCKQKHQLTTAFIISTVYGLVMMAVFIGIVIQTMEDGILSPTTLFFLLVVFQVVITGLLHPQEAGALICGLVYYITIPSMYMLLVIYSLFNMNDVSWGTRENPVDKPTDPKQEQPTQEQGRFNKMFSFLQSGQQKEEGSIDISFAGLFRCMLCTHPKSNDEQAQLIQIADRLGEINNKMKDLEMKLTGEVTVMRSEEESTISSTKKESITEEQPEKSINYLPDWLYDTDLRNGETETLSTTEEKFWYDLIEKYLKPIDKSEKELEDVKTGLKGLRDMSVFAFVMINALFVLVVFILQLNKEYIHVRWPLGAKDFILYDDSTTEITISRVYLELDPIGLVFIVFFGVILFIQFGAMLMHRFSTISQILATTALDWYCGKQPEEMSEAEELRGKAVNIAMHLQKPEAQWDENEISKDVSVIGRRDTIHRILYQHKNKQDWSNLEANFKRRIFADGDLQMGRVTVSRKTINLLDNRRKSMKDIRIHRKSVKLNQQMMTDPYDTSEPQWMQNQQQQHQQMRHNSAPPPEYDRMESDLNPRILNLQGGNDNRGYQVASSDSDDDFEMTDKKRVAFA